MGVAAAWNARSICVGDINALKALFSDALPLGPSLLANASRSLASALLAGVLLLLLDAAGIRLLAWLMGRCPGGIARYAAVFVGYFGVSGFLLGAAAAGLWFTPLLGAVLAAMLMACGREMVRSLRLAAGFLGTGWRNSSPGGRVAWVVAGAVEIGRAHV